MHPHNPVAAVSHGNPYPYYSTLLEGPPLVFDAALKLWVASRAALHEEIFAHPNCTVRPAAEQVPAALAGSSAGEVFAHLVRMNEDAGHLQPKRVLQQALAGVDLAVARDRTDTHAAALAAVHHLPDSIGLTPWTFDLPTYVVADLLGFEHAEMAQLAAWMTDFVRSLSPLSSTAQLADADLAARALQQRFTAFLHAGAARPTSLLARVRDDAAATGWADQAAIVANLIGLLSQTHEATAGLIGNSLVALATRPQLQAELRRDRSQVEELVREVARFDPPVQNTRRFVAHACSIGGVALAAGDTILLLLAAAGRDPAMHPQPDELLLARAQPALPAFGHGRHACPGQQLALTIAARAVDYILTVPGALDALNWTYRDSPNARLPVFAPAHQLITKELS